MNLIDFIVLALLALYVLNGLYRGFMPSLVNMGGFFFSWLFSFLLYPLLSRALISTKLFSSVQYYIEGAEYISDVELAKMPITSFTGEQINSIVTSSKVPTPYNTAIINNISNKAFESKGIVTLGEYYNLSIYNVMMNILSILILFLIVRVICTLLINAYSYSTPLPQLVQYDTLMGGSIGLLRGFFSFYLLFMFVPILLTMFPIPAITTIVNGSFSSSIFYSNSILLKFISGVI